MKTRSLDNQRWKSPCANIADEVVGDYAKSAMKSWDQMVKIYLLEDAGIEPIVSLVANDNWMEFTVRYVVSFKKRRGTKDALFTRILDEFAATDSKVEFASATFHLVETPTIDVRLTNSTN